MVAYKLKISKGSGKRKKSVTLPSQTMSIQEMVKRFVKGMPVDAVRRQGVYIDQSEHDLEKIARSDFSEKADMAQALAERTEAVSQAIESNERAQRERKQKEQGAKASKPAEGAGIDSLDNTMPVDTDLTNN